MNHGPIRGVLAPVVTPFDEHLEPDVARLAGHCRWLLDGGCHGLAVFGTTSEANSLSVDERIALLDGLVAAGIDPQRLVVGVGCCALTDTARLAAHAVDAGCAAVLMLPPFYYKDVSAEGLFRAIAQTIERVGRDKLRICLYHIPPVAQVGFSIELTGRLIHEFPGIVTGMKDSSGDWNHTREVIDTFPGFDVFSGNELSLLANLRHGGAGCITATANVNPGPVRVLFDRRDGPDAKALQRQVAATRTIIAEYPVIAALKAIIADYSSDEAWCRVRPPLVDLSDAGRESLLASLSRQGFDMPGIRRAQAP